VRMKADIDLWTTRLMRRQQLLEGLAVVFGWANGHEVDGGETGATDAGGG